MGQEKGGTKSGGFFHLFDWNKKSRKKLFSNGTEGTKQGKRSDENLPAAQLRLTDEDEVVGVSSAKGSSNYSCASSVTDEEGNGVRAPGVVARLMGLDSMPTSGVSEPYSTPLFDTQSLRDNRSYKRSPEFCINDQFNHVLHRGEGYPRKPMDFRSQKMPSSPIERFQREILPPRSAKSLPIPHHKLLSPIKNPGFISTKNAADIMEAAAKILEPGRQPSTKGKFPSFGSSSMPLKVRDSKESLEASQRASRILESARTPVDSTDFRYLRGQPLNRSWNGSENTAGYRRSSESEGSNLSSCAKGKGKSISLAIQAKVNVQKREGLSTGCRNTLDQKDHEECKLNQLFKSQPSNQKNKPQKKLSTANASGVLRQNNQKQNCPSSKGKLASKQSFSNQQGRKVASGDGFAGKNKTASKLSGNSGVGRKEGLETSDFDREGLSSSNKDFPQKKRLIERGFHSDKCGFADNILVDRHGKNVQQNVVIDEHLRWTEDNKRNSMDVVSFTFTSPLIKPIPGSRSSTQVVGKSDNRNIYCFDTTSEKSTSSTKGMKLSSLGLNVISGDALSLLLEQKLRELTAGFDLSNCNFVKTGSSAASSPVLQESVSAFDTVSTTRTEHEKEFLLGPCKDKPEAIFGYGVSSTNDQFFGVNRELRGSDEVECSSSSDARKDPDLQHPSPLSILEAAFSNESCNSTENSGSTNGGKMCSSSVQAQNCADKILQVESETEFLDSASSEFTEIVEVEHASEVGTGNTTTYEKDMEYVREVLRYSGSTATEALDPLLFDKLETRRSRTTSHGEDKESKLRRKVLFDCVTECLESRRSRYFSAGYRSWAKGAAAVGKDPAEELYREISGWKSMGDWMVDELVDTDMSNHLGRWVDFEIEAFEAGVEIERAIFGSLVDDVVTDFLIKKPRR